MSLFRDVRQRQLKLFNSFPAWVTYSPGQINDPDIDTCVLVWGLFATLDHLQNLFVLDRLLLRHGYVGRGEVLPVIFEVLETTLLFWRRKDRFSNLLKDFPYIVRISTSYHMVLVLCVDFVLHSANNFSQ